MEYVQGQQTQEHPRGEEESEICSTASTIPVEGVGEATTSVVHTPDSGSKRRRLLPEDRVVSKSFYSRADAAFKPSGQSQTGIRILLVRHGKSEANCDTEVMKRVADHSVALAHEGEQQAQETGRLLRRYFEHLQLTEIGFKPKAQHIRMWVSPYKRARSTATHILERCNSRDQWITDVREHVSIVLVAAVLLRYRSSCCN